MAFVAFLNGLMAQAVSRFYAFSDSSMEASNGLNPYSSQGLAEIQSVEAKILAKAGQIKA